jgi:hypothetical protein
MPPGNKGMVQGAHATALACAQLHYRVTNLKRLAQADGASGWEDARDGVPRYRDGLHQGRRGGGTRAAAARGQRRQSAPNAPGPVAPEEA